MNSGVIDSGRVARPARPWPMVRLGDVCCRIVDGSHNPPKGTNLSDFPMLSSKNVQDGKITLENPRYLSRSDFEVENRRTNVTAGDVLFTIVGTIGRVAKVLPGFPKFCLQRSVAVLKPQTSIVDADYIVLQLISQRDLLEKKAQGVAQKGLYLKQLSEILIPLPPLSVQREMVGRLEKELGKADELAAKSKRLGALADELFKSELDAAFKNVKGEKVRLGDVFKFIDYRGKTPTKISFGVPLVTARNVRMGYMDYEERFYISKAEYKTRQSRGIAHKGDLLFTTEAPLGYIAIADLDEFSTGQRIITFQWPDENIQHDNGYFLYYCMSELFQSQVMANASGALAQGIKSSRLEKLIVIIPDFSVQTTIRKRLDAARERSEKLKAAAERGAALAAELRKSILQEAFA